jgi:uncharacterized membrane protein YgcG
MATFFRNTVVWLIGAWVFLAFPNSFSFQTAPKSVESETVPKLPIPALRDRIMDLACILKDAESEDLKAKLKSLESDTTTQMAVLIIPSLQGEILEEYSLRIANTWKLGRKDLNNGVLLLIALQDRALRIEVGLLGIPVIRTHLEDKVLQEKLDGYHDYPHAIRFRLISGVW